MGKYLKLFKTRADYDAYIAQGNKGFPIISFCEDNGETYVNQVAPETRIIATFNVNSTRLETKILSSTTSVVKIEIDGVELPEVVTGYTFQTTGEHEVKYTLKDETKIADYTFISCSCLKSVRIPKNVTEIGVGAFHSCLALSSVSFYSNIADIKSYAFAFCTNLESIYIPSNVKHLGDSVFSGCGKLKSITSLALTPPTIQNNTFADIANDGTLHVHKESDYNIWMDCLGKSGWVISYM